MAIAKASESEATARVSDELSQDDLSEMLGLLESGIPKNRAKAVTMGTHAVSAAGLAMASTTVGAAIGTSLLPGVGTAVGAGLALLLSKMKGRDPKG